MTYWARSFTCLKDHSSPTQEVYEYGCDDVMIPCEGLRSSKGNLGSPWPCRGQAYVMTHHSLEAVIMQYCRHDAKAIYHTSNVICPLMSEQEQEQ